jgi:hypothetical protein
MNSVLPIAAALRCMRPVSAQAPARVHSRAAAAVTDPELAQPDVCADLLRTREPP